MFTQLSGAAAFRGGGVSFGASALGAKASPFDRADPFLVVAFAPAFPGDALGVLGFGASAFGMDALAVCPIGVSKPGRSGINDECLPGIATELSNKATEPTKCCGHTQPFRHTAVRYTRHPSDRPQGPEDGIQLHILAVGSNVQICGRARGYEKEVS
jgi:hypothetical protein